MTASRSQVGAEHRQVVADHDQAEAELAHQVGQQVEHLRLDHHVERGRRLVGDDQLRPAGQRHRDHDALLLAAGELVRVRRAPAARGRPTCSSSSPTRLAAGGSADARVVQQDRLGDLLADALHRVERVHRALEDDRRLAPSAPRAARPNVIASTSSPSSRTSPVDLRADAGSSRSTVDGQRRLARSPDSPAMPSVCPASTSGRRRAPRAPGRRAVAVGDRRGPRVSSRRHRLGAVAAAGRAMASSARPTRVNASTTRTTQMPGGSRYHQAPVRDRAGWRTRRRASCPRTTAGGSPRPRKDSVVSDRIAIGDGQRRVGEHQRHHVGQHVPGHLVPVAAAERPGPLDVGPGLDGQGLGPHQPGRAGPGRDADDEDDR